jgi:hypothetical protein
MSLNDDGFLSEDIVEYQRKIRGHYAKYFDMIHRVNVFCQQKKFDLSIPSHDGQKIIAAGLMVKLLNDMQAAILLVERGLGVQAGILIRTGVETLIILSNVWRFDDFWRSYVYSDQSIRLKLSRAIQSNKSVAFDEVRPYITPEIISQLDQEIKDKGITEEKVIELAKRANLMALYDAHYRIFSQNVHSSPRIIEKYCLFDQNDEPTELKWYPQIEGIEGELTSIPRIMLLGVAATSGIFGLNLDEDIARLSAELKILENPPNQGQSI